ncbi:MAG: GNAT family N-acetyltransferase [Ferruginibacter sp.]
MNYFTNEHISVADNSQVTEIMHLLNNAYRGENSKKGWTTEANLIAGDRRADVKMLVDTMGHPGSIFLLYTDEANKILGCVNLQKHDNRMYLGMFSVWPELQGAGIGKIILQASEEYARQRLCQSIYMSVISARTELIDWYKRHGYRDTGEKKPFEEDGVTGKHLQKLEFMILEKKLS